MPHRGYTHLDAFFAVVADLLLLMRKNIQNARLLKYRRGLFIRTLICLWFAPEHYHAETCANLSDVSILCPCGTGHGGLEHFITRS